MRRYRLLYAGILVLACFASGCTEDVGPCEDILDGRDPVVLTGAEGKLVVYGGQALMNRACATGCHSSSASGYERRGAPAGLDFDLLPVDEEDAAGSKNSGGKAIVKLRSAQIQGLRERQSIIVENRDAIWQQVRDGLMPPGGGAFEAVMSNIFAVSGSKPCVAGRSYAKLGTRHAREVFRNWLACGAPLVETNGKKVAKSNAAGAAGYQFPACEAAPPAASVTLESMLKTTLSECGLCHNVDHVPPPRFIDAEGLAADLRAKGKCSEKPFVTPGKPEKSYLLDLLKGPDEECGIERMPPGNPFSARAIAQVEAWIAAGAPTTAEDQEAGGAEGEGSDDERAARKNADGGRPKDAGADAGRKDANR